MISTVYASCMCTRMHPAPDCDFDHKINHTLLHNLAFDCFCKSVQISFNNLRKGREPWGDKAITMSLVGLAHAHPNYTCM